ncbi:MAG: cytochrome c3 family protein, partial [Phycisphaerae bacterium]
FAAALLGSFVCVLILAADVPEPATNTETKEQRDPASGILGSKHDFTDDGKNTRDLCLPCHTPHITSREAPLLTTAATKRTAGPARGSDAIVYDDSSRLCLSCHDGVIAKDVYASPHAASWRELDSGSVRGGRSRITSHPVGIRYPVDQRSYYPASALRVDEKDTVPLVDGRIQCITCHDPHNTERHPGMLVKSNQRSKLCLACHRL